MREGSSRQEFLIEHISKQLETAASRRTEKHNASAANQILQLVCNQVQLNRTTAFSIQTKVHTFSSNKTN